jgi:hypothetical protein
MDNVKYDKICSDLLSKLDERQKAILSRRFALGQNEKETLESIGKDFGICRERVRQIENVALKKVRKNSSKYKKVFTGFVNYLKKFGGIKREESLLQDLGSNQEKELSFLLNVKKDIKRKKENNDFYSVWVLDQEKYLEAKQIVKQAIKYLKKNKDLVKFAELKELFSKKDQALSSYFESSKVIRTNDEGLYGLSNWPEINPRGIKDKAYLAFKEVGKPLHFSKVSELIENSNVQTVHNELIKNDKFILVGRGMYALSEWGYEPGKVKDVIARTLEEANKPLKKEEIVQKVLDKRIVKKNTILLNLGDKEKFQKKDDGTYNIRSA